MFYDRYIIFGFLFESVSNAFLFNSVTMPSLSRKRKIILSYKEKEDEFLYGMTTGQKNDRTKIAIRNDILNRIESRFFNLRILQDKPMESESFTSHVFKASYQDMLDMDILEVISHIDVNEIMKAALEHNDVEGAWLDQDVDYGLGKVNNQNQERQNYFSNDSKISINAEEAWRFMDRQENLSEIVVGLLDTGVDLQHRDLQGQIYQGKEICGTGIDDDQNGFIDDCNGWNFVDNNNNVQDDNGHGTASAGIIAANSNANGLKPICKTCKILPVKVLDHTVKGVISNFVKGINYLVKRQIKLSNNSYGVLGKEFPAMEKAIIKAERKGMLFVAAAGNFSCNTDIPVQKFYPASYNQPNILSVASVIGNGRIADFSCYGTSIDLAAPGEAIYTTFLNNKYIYLNGTSMSTPMVTATAAMLWSYEPFLHYSQVKQRILLNTRKLPELHGKLKTEGVLDISAALLNNNNFLKKSMYSTCEQQNQCTTNSYCQQINNNILCKCKKGYILKNNVCIDINECYNNTCRYDNMKCINHAGGYNCKCDVGYILQNNVCVDINECNLLKTFPQLGFNNICPNDAICINYLGNFDCRCLYGFIYHNISVYPVTAQYFANYRQHGVCLPIAMPVSGPCMNNGGCGANSVCKITGLLFKQCLCVNGYTFRNGICIRY